MPKSPPGLLEAMPVPIRQMENTIRMVLPLEKEGSGREGASALLNVILDHSEWMNSEIEECERFAP